MQIVVLLFILLRWLFILKISTNFETGETSMSLTTYFIGAGRVTRILLSGLKQHGHLPDRIIVTDPDRKSLETLLSAIPECETETEVSQKIGEADLVFISLHPPVIPDVLKNLSSFVQERTTIVSLAPKLSTQKIQELLGVKLPVIRMIPNAPSIVLEGFNPVSFSPECSDSTRTIFKTLMAPLGQMPEVKEESLEAYAVLSAMGPTYFWFQMAELIRLGEKFGLSREDAMKAVCVMTSGAAHTMMSSGLSPEEVTDLIPVKPLKEHEETIRSIYDSAITGFYEKLRS